MKDELRGKIMTEFVALRAKMYAYKKIDKKVKDKRCKVTESCIVAEILTFDNFKTCLSDGKTIQREQMLFENNDLKVYTVNTHRIVFNRAGDKRLVQSDGITTLARGYIAVSA